MVQNLSMIKMSFCMSNLRRPSSGLLAGGRCDACHMGDSSAEGVSSTGWGLSWGILLVDR
jgi:hypothetical protein